MQQRDKSSPYQPSTNGFEHQPAGHSIMQLQSVPSLNLLSKMQN